MTEMQTAVLNQPVTLVLQCACTCGGVLRGGAVKERTGSDRRVQNPVYVTEQCLIALGPSSRRGQSVRIGRQIHTAMSMWLNCIGSRAAVIKV